MAPAARASLLVLAILATRRAPARAATPPPDADYPFEARLDVAPAGVYALDAWLDATRDPSGKPLRRLATSKVHIFPTIDFGVADDAGLLPAMTAALLSSTADTLAIEEPVSARRFGIEVAVAEVAVAEVAVAEDASRDPVEGVGAAAMDQMVPMERVDGVRLTLNLFAETRFRARVVFWYDRAPALADADAVERCHHGFAGPERCVALASAAVRFAVDARLPWTEHSEIQAPRASAPGGAPPAARGGKPPGPDGAASPGTGGGLPWQKASIAFRGLPPPGTSASAWAEGRPFRSARDLAALLPPRLLAAGRALAARATDDPAGGRSSHAPPGALPLPLAGALPAGLAASVRGLPETTASLALAAAAFAPTEAAEALRRALSDLVGPSDRALFSDAEAAARRAAMRGLCAPRPGSLESERPDLRTAQQRRAQLLSPAFEGAGMRAHVPAEVPPELCAQFTLAGSVPVGHRYFDNSFRSSSYAPRSRAYIDALIERAARREPWYYAETDASLWRALEIHPVRGKSVLIVGSTHPWYEAICVEAGAARCVTVEYNALAYAHPRMETLTAAEAEADLQRGAKESRLLHAFDAVWSVSSFEHDGLGRYGDPIAPWADLRAMAGTRRYLKKAGIPNSASGGHTPHIPNSESPGLLFLAVPTGYDALLWNANRVYGPARLPLLLDGWDIVGAFGLGAALGRAEEDAGIRGTPEGEWALAGRWERCTLDEERQPVLVLAAADERPRVPVGSAGRRGKEGL
jgi:hypothetical protein